MKYISCWCMLTFCSYQYLIEISMYWKVRSAWAWFKSKWIFSKKKPNNNQPQCFFKDLIDSKDKCECKNGIPRLGWLKGSSLKKDLEHLCFWSSSLRPGQEESCVMCACWAMPKKKKKHSAKSWHHMVWNWRQKCMSDVRTDGVSFSWRLMCGCVAGFVVRSHAGASPEASCAVPCLCPVRPLSLPRPPPSREVWVIACPWSGIVLVLLLHCSRLASSGFGALSLSFSLSTPLLFLFLFFFFQGYLSFCFPPLNTLEADGLTIYNPKWRN